MTDDIGRRMANATDVIHSESMWLKEQSARVASELDRVEPMVRDGWQHIRALEGALQRVTNHLETWAADHSEERTAEIDAAIFCARELLTK